MASKCYVTFEPYVQTRLLGIIPDPLNPRMVTLTEHLKRKKTPCRFEGSGLPPNS